MDRPLISAVILARPPSIVLSLGVMVVTGNEYGRILLFWLMSSRDGSSADPSFSDRMIWERD